MEYVLETLGRLQSQQQAILRAAIGQARESDLDQNALGTLEICISECLDDAFYPRAAPLLAELEEHDRAVAMTEHHQDIVEFQRRVR